MAHERAEAVDMMVVTTPTRWLTCCVCGTAAGRWQQHWNRDTGYGICPGCIAWQRAHGTSEEEIERLYGRAGVNYSPDPPARE